jgi:hypothetical protein
LEVDRVLFASLLRQALIALGDGERVLLLAVAGTIGVGEEGRWRRRKEFCFLERLDVREVHIAAVWRARGIPLP